MKLISVTLACVLKLAAVVTPYSLNHNIIEKQPDSLVKRATGDTYVCNNSGYSYYQYGILDEALCYSKDPSKNNWSCFAVANSLTTFVDYPHTSPVGTTGMRRRICVINRSSTSGLYVTCSPDPGATCESIDVVNPCETLTTTLPYVLKNRICQCKSLEANTQSDGPYTSTTQTTQSDYPGTSTTQTTQSDYPDTYSSQLTSSPQPTSSKSSPSISYGSSSTFLEFDCFSEDDYYFYDYKITDSMLCQYSGDIEVRCFGLYTNIYSFIDYPYDSYYHDIYDSFLTHDVPRRECIIDNYSYPEARVICYKDYNAPCGVSSFYSTQICLKIPTNVGGYILNDAFCSCGNPGVTSSQYCQYA
ncbi:hypothetical protein BB560_003206 [Smittium megazygosporum]|uniref:Uncharacterized protein n=1 Tax=Smittium megazygosporum TaxID=133381 RepID=A0A2T9ZCM8_9FUNG|nr:hypothetical protein BB560_003206 [Smittium megazygosporum]